ncbi:MAG: chitobiase/beta-hexosaminidase C-terminal domain-containing protein [Acidobacteriota bacterium]|nr:chitobiase/beta-hexosaminidase C-terminal domain-containing protein [Acidobacteriota bacterium]
MKYLAIFPAPLSPYDSVTRVMHGNRAFFHTAKVVRTAAAVSVLLFCVVGAQGQTNVVTQHNDIGRTGQNRNETVLTPANVNSSSFGKLFSYAIDGRAYAQPLYVPGITMGSGTPQAGTRHHVVFIATEHDSVYAFDADNNGGTNASPLWKVSLLDSAHGATSGATTVPYGDVSSSDIVPEIGITGTPVIDINTNTMYVVGKTKENSNYVQRLHALDITTGNEKSGSPVTLAAQVSGNGTGSSGGVLKFDPKWELNRPGLLLLNGNVYLGFAAHGDNGPWHGWILAYNASSLQQTGAFCSTSNGSGSGIWMSGAGLAADTVNSGRLFVATGNGAFNANNPPYTNSMSYGDDLIRLDVNNGAMNVGDHFTPLNQTDLNSRDADVSSGGVLLLPDQTSGGHTHLMVQVGKEGRIYLVDRDSLGGYNSSSDNIVQEIPVNPNTNFSISGLWSMPAYWNGNLYFWGSGDNLTAFSFASGKIGGITSSSSEYSGFPGATPSVSSNGTSNGIVWDVLSSAYNSSGPAVLLAHNATNVATTLYSSNQNLSRDNPGQATKFVVPTVVNGKVYVGTANFLSVFGLLSATQQAAAPVMNPGGQSFSGTLSVTITDSTPGASIYYTTNGSTPTTSSAKYSGSITVSTTETINAIASASGFVQSAVSSETYNLQTQALAPTFSPVAGSFSSTQLVTLSSDTAGATIYYTTDGSTPAPGAGSTKLYSSAISVASTQTIKAVATLAGLSNSPVASATYTITAGGTGINFVNGFSSSQSVMTFNGSTVLNDTRLQLTNGGFYQAGSAWFNTPVNITNFTNDFAFQLENADADGITFTIENNGLNSLGGAGGGLAYTGILKSVAIKFDLYNNNGEGDDSIGIFQNGAAPYTPSIDLNSSGIDLHNGDTFSVHMTYNGVTLAMTITDGVTGAVYSTSWAINIPQVIGSNTAYVGFTGGTGGTTASQKIETWTYLTNTITQQATATPTFSPAAGTYLGAQTVTISDATSGAAIFYTTDGSTPATTAGGSTLAYSGPLTVTSTKTIKVIAKTSTLAASAVATATYTIQQQASAPIFSPGGGTYATSQSVTLTSPTAGAAVYYTADGSTPTTSSTLYVGPISVASTKTIKAMAVVSGYFNSAVSTAVYTISASGGSSVSLAGGFIAGSMALNGSAALNGTKLRLTDGNASEAGAAWYGSSLNIQKFNSSFSFQITPASAAIADGMTFAIQGNGTTALGPLGGGLGYGPDNAAAAISTSNPLHNSVALKFDLYDNAGEGINSTGLYVNGASPTAPSLDLTGSGVDLHSGHVMNVQIGYDGTNLTMTITDPTVNSAFTHSWPINIPTTIGGNSAYVGFTGGTGGQSAVQDVLKWTFSSLATSGTTATPVIIPGTGTFASAQSVIITDATAGATMYYTSDGSQPTTSSPKYTGAFTVSVTTTIKAIAVANGSTSATATSNITIQAPGSTAGISFASGFTSTGLQLNGNAVINGSRLQLTDTSNYFEDSSAFWTQKVDVQNFTNDFKFQITNPLADGLTFTIQGVGVTALGGAGGELGYGPYANGTPGIAKSVAIKFDIYNNGGEGTNSTGLYLNGADPIGGSTALGGGVSLQSGDVFAVHMTYNGSTLTMSITDTADPSQTFTTSWPVNITSAVGSTSAYVGFTGATGGSVATQQILTWSFASGKPPLVFQTTSLAGTAVTSGPALRLFSYAGFPDGAGTILDSTNVGDYVVFTVPVPTAAIYNIKVSYKQFGTRGIMRAAVNSTNVGSPVDEFIASGDAYAISDLGNLNFSSAGNYLFKFTVVGKNAGSSGYTLSFDTITLTPQ